MTGELRVATLRAPHAKSCEPKTEQPTDKSNRPIETSDDSHKFWSSGTCSFRDIPPLAGPLFNHRGGGCLQGL